MSRRKKNCLLIAFTLCLYVINQHIKSRIPFNGLRWFMVCYFNDIIGSITFMAYCNVIFEFHQRYMSKLRYILLMMLGCGIVWEVIAPIYRHDTVADPWDIIAYLFGGFLYWLFVRRDKKGAEHIHDTRAA